MINKKEDLYGTIFNIADEEGYANVRLAGLFYDVCTKYGISVMGGNGRDYFMKATGEGLVNLCIADDDGLVAFGRVSVSEDSAFGADEKSMRNFRHISECELKAHLEDQKPLDAIEQAEWNGEGLPPVGGKVVIRYMYDSKTVCHCGCVLYASESHCILDINGKECHYLMCDYQYEKPETPEAKKEREEIEAAEELYSTYMKIWNNAYIGWAALDDKNKEAFLAIVRKTGYRKGE